VRKTLLVMAGTALMVALMAVPAFAQKPQKDNGPDPARVRELIQQAMQQIQPVPAQAPAQPFKTAGPRVDLSLQEAVQRGSEHNIDIGVARITPRVTEFSLIGLEANYRPNLTSSFTDGSVTNFPTNITQGITQPTATGTYQWVGGLTQNLWWGGSSYTAGWTNTRTNSPSTTATRNPNYDSRLTATLTQPLMRGFKIDATRASLQTNRIGQQNDEITLQSTIFSTQSSVKNAYWDLVFAVQAVDAAQGSLDLASRLVQDNQARVEIGTLAPIDVVSAQAEQANRKLALVQAQGTVRTAELALKRLIVSGTDDPLWTSSLNPVDRPPTTAEPINLEAAVTRALRERTDLQQSMNNLKISDINLRQQVDLTRPQLNLSATYGLRGVGGPFIQKTGVVDPLTGQSSSVSTVIPSGYLDAIRTLGRFDAPQWNFALNFSYPLGLSAQEANVARSKLSLEQTQAQLKSLQLQVATDVTNAALTVQSSLESVQATAAARELSKQKLDAAQSKFEVGMATNFEVVQAQRDFSDAQNNELRAVLNYRKALVSFETSQTVGTRAVSSSVTGGGGGTTTGTSGGTSGGSGGGGL
jgi:outer membrane protein